MNLLVSYNWLKKYLKTSLSSQDFAKRVSVSGPSVERLYPQAPQFDHMVVGRILAIEPHPNADKLRLVKTDIGSKTIKLVCGGSNLTENMLVAVALVGAKVRWHGQGELITLEPAEIRGIKSDGMICGADEIALGDAFPKKAEKEILDLTWTKAKAGTSLAKALDHDDTIMDIEVTTNRPDAFSIIGFARESSAILGAPFIAKDPNPKILAPKKKSLALDVKITSKIVSRYRAITLNNIAVSESPWWIKSALLSAGIRPINNVVDVTNFVMLEYGQPLHAFDYNTVAGGNLVIREAKQDESLTLLGGKTITLNKGMLVIADKKNPLALAGVMGGEASGVTASTTSIILESATFEPVSIRRTARSFHLHTDAALRFEKGLQPENVTPALARAVELLIEITGATVASQATDFYPKKPKNLNIVVRQQKIADLIGVEVPAKKMFASLIALGFTISKKTKTQCMVTVPAWRRDDIETERDIAEEVARLIGYASLPSELPTGEIPRAPQDLAIMTDERTRTAFKEYGYTELVQYSFVSGDMMEKAQIDTMNLITIANPLTADFVYMRPSLIPSTLETIRENQDRFPSAKLFEIAKIYPKTKDNTTIPLMIGRTLAVSYGHDEIESTWRTMKGELESFVGVTTLSAYPQSRIESEPIWHPGRTTRFQTTGGEILATLGEINPVITRAFGIAKRVVALELHRETLAKLGVKQQRYQTTPEFPPALRDLAFVVAEKITYEEIEKSIKKTSLFITNIELFDIFRGKSIGENKKSLALHLTFSDPAATLTTETVEREIDTIRQVLQTSFNAQLRS